MKRIVLSAATLLALLSAHAEIRMPKFFGDHMVLQRERPIRVWGEAAKNETVTIRFHEAEVAVRADRTGRWRAELPALPAGGPYEMTVEGRDNALHFTDILVGDVWLCSGQSNMELRLDSSAECEAAIADAANPRIRLLSVGDKIAFEAANDIESGSWVECIPETARVFSAVGYYFGKFIEAETGVPIGLIDSSWGGTDIETWTSWETMRRMEEYEQYAAKKSPREALGKLERQYEEYSAALKDDRGDRERWYDPAVPARPKEWKTMELPQNWENVLGPTDGRIWFRRTVALPASAAGKAGVLHLAAVDDTDITYVNGRRIGETTAWNLPRCYELAAGVLHEGENLIAIRVEDPSGGGGIWGAAEDLYLEVDGLRYDLRGEWLYRPSATTTMFGITDDKGCNPNCFASLLYNGMIAPLAGYGIKGAIWYQGENNASRAQSYRRLFPAMIRDWRRQWGYEFPFFWVQLASYMAVRPEPGESEWAELREAQNRTLALPATGQAVITDIGEADDIHPRNKRDVGYRLSRAALRVAYGRGDVAANGPVYRSMEHDGNRLVLTFETTGSLRPADGNRYGYLRGFAVAGADRKFVWARACVLDDERIAVFSDDVPCPVAVRYGWEDNPCDDDLTDSSGLPASPFRTDDWPGITR
ncbi:MAG: 9-O-acetylesterase [Alistipes sp.]|nr:9-O-acetylesterase [Alistipes senegalensis]MCM1250528.1 9-O-acetylesterase [Alistipes sp.]